MSRKSKLGIALIFFVIMLIIQHRVKLYEKTSIPDGLKYAMKGTHECYKQWRKSHPDFQLAKIIFHIEIQKDGSGYLKEILKSEEPSLNHCIEESYSQLQFMPPPWPLHGFIHTQVFSRDLLTANQLNSAISSY